MSAIRFGRLREGTYLTCPIFPQAEATGGRVQDSYMFYQRILAIH